MQTRLMRSVLDTYFLLGSLPETLLMYPNGFDLYQPESFRWGSYEGPEPRCPQGCWADRASTRLAPR
jgi:hypothetical protein